LVCGVGDLFSILYNLNIIFLFVFFFARNNLKAKNRVIRWPEIRDIINLYRRGCTANGKNIYFIRFQWTP